jgi:hypothetical protein
MNVREATRSHVFGSPSSSEGSTPERLDQTEKTGSTYRDLFHDYFDACGRDAGHGVPIFAQQTECGDFAGEVLEYPSLFAPTL